MIEIPQQTVTELLQLGGQYLLPIAALLRALYNGYRQKLPEGIAEIVAASVFTGVTALVDNQQLDARSLILELLGNTVLMAGLLMFIVIYLLRIRNHGYVVDAIVGGFIGIAFWLGWVYLLGNDWPWWTLGVTAIAGAVGFVLLRKAMRVLAVVMRIATYFIVAGLITVAIAGGILGLQWLGVIPPLG
ncbi:MAG: hypothetical protein IH587_14520 [Anaerolineae bacterium]|nr:hypothetical protein [Anaerolineae bacterium]